MSQPSPARRFDSKSSRYHEDNARVAANTKLEIVRRLSMIVDRGQTVKNKSMKKSLSSPADEWFHRQVPEKVIEHDFITSGVPSGGCSSDGRALA